MIERGHHDMGGLPAGRVERTEHDYAEWERRVDAMVQLLRLSGRITVDELRKNIEALPPQAYDTMAYYEKWVASLANILLQRGLVTSDEIGRKMEQIRGRSPISPGESGRSRPGTEPDLAAGHSMSMRSGSVPEFRFKPGDAVRVRAATPPGHIRTPFYIRGHAGVIERLCGAFPNPEELAQMRDGLPAQPLYRVRFRQKDVWPGYAGSPQDVLEVEIFQHWLEGA